jgi:hypothetical protein
MEQLKEGTLYDENGNKLADIKDITVFSEIKPIEPEFDFNIDYLKEAKMYTTISPLNTEIRLTDLVPEDNENPEFTLGYHICVPKRRHHKKRIQKKWAKQYGFYDMPVEIGPFKQESIKQTGDISEITWRR